jgi:methyl-accepting chemotaxis protein
MEEQIKKSFVEFNNSMGTLIKRQDNSLKQFDASMTIVSENITEVTGEFKKLKEKLERSLSVVSSSNRELKNSLEIMDTIHKEYRELISSLDVAVNKMSKNLLVVTPNNSTTLKNN